MFSRSPQMTPQRRSCPPPGSRTCPRRPLPRRRFRRRRPRLQNRLRPCRRRRLMTLPLILALRQSLRRRPRRRRRQRLCTRVSDVPPAALCHVRVMVVGLGLGSGSVVLARHHRPHPARLPPPGRCNNSTPILHCEAVMRSTAQHLFPLCCSTESIIVLHL